MHKPEWLKFVRSAYKRLLAMRPVPFATLVPSQIPELSGVYLITMRKRGVERPYYVGRSKNLRRRLYNNHLMGPVTNARLKRYLISTGECADLVAAKQFIKKYCFVRWVGEADIRKRGAIEGYLTGVPFPKYGIYEEH
jgi:hypothetical protein